MDGPEIPSETETDFSGLGEANDQLPQLGRAQFRLEELMEAHTNRAMGIMGSFVLAFSQISVIPEDFLLLASWLTLTYPLEIHWHTCVTPTQRWTPAPDQSGGSSGGNCDNIQGSQDQVMTVYHQTGCDIGPLILKEGFHLGKVGWCGGGVYFAMSPKATVTKAPFGGVAWETDRSTSMPAQSMGKAREGGRSSYDGEDGDELIVYCASQAQPAKVVQWFQNCPGSESVIFCLDNPEWIPKDGGFEDTGRWVTRVDGTQRKREVWTCYRKSSRWLKGEALRKLERNFTATSTPVRFPPCSVRGECVCVMAEIMEMKVSTKKDLGFFLRAARVFLQGADAKEDLPARKPVDELQVSGLGEAIKVAVNLSTRLEDEGIANIESVSTHYKEVDSYGAAPQILIRLRRRIVPVDLQAPVGGLSLVTWNLAAINNNPFEFWISHSDEAYAKLMDQVEAFIDDPKEKDVPVASVFTEDLFKELQEQMKALEWQGLEKVEEIWRSDLQQRKIISGVLKDKDLGAKRLMSMPDRFTNTVNLASGTMAFRPTVINHSSNKLASVAEWWPQWRDFMFKEELELKTGKNGDTKRIRPCQMLTTIKKAKYPAITDEEEAVSIPLQCLCLAIFDAVLVHMLQVLSPDGHWQDIKSSICEATFRKKNQLTCRILESYSAASVICLQEASAAFLYRLRHSHMALTHHVVAPSKIDEQRDQNSAILLRKDAFPDGSEEELTDEVIGALQGTALEAGDLIALRACHAPSGQSFLIASFHGDTNGQATAPLLRALKQVAKGEMLVGMDANTYLHGSSTFYGVKEFLDECKGLGYRSCFEGDMAKCLTTCNARTFLQPQLNKACRSSMKLEKGDVNPKDHIIFALASFEVLQTVKDNTGKGEYIEGACFPSLSFPSDHGLVSVVLKPKS
ncbi:unnamed protein product [Durusdinium trenchii]|uniref:Uncharacterized protein n=1 Tax=Durusdinium trenchii TaxID=1381693 RepID=A0ABP0P4U0_9DINO